MGAKWAQGPPCPQTQCMLEVVMGVPPSQSQSENQIVVGFVMLQQSTLQSRKHINLPNNLLDYWASWIAWQIETSGFINLKILNTILQLSLACIGISSIIWRKAHCWLVRLAWYFIFHFLFYFSITYYDRVFQGCWWSSIKIMKLGALMIVLEKCWILVSNSEQSICDHFSHIIYSLHSFLVILLRLSKMVQCRPLESSSIYNRFVMLVS